VRRRLTLTAIGAAALALTAGTVVTAATAAPASAALLPKTIALPNGYQPEGIATNGAVFIPGTAGDTVRGLKVDGERLFAAAGPSGTVKVYDVRSGRLLLRQQVGAPGASFVDDMVVARSAAYYTDSTAKVMYVLPFGTGGRLGTARAVPLTGDIVYGAGFNATASWPARTAGRSCSCSPTPACCSRSRRAPGSPPASTPAGSPSPTATGCCAAATRST
jgi:hypothetical protein